MITFIQTLFEKCVWYYSKTSPAIGKRHETGESVCDTGAILGEQQEAVGEADGKMGAGDWVSPLSLSSLCVLVASGHKG